MSLRQKIAVAAGGFAFAVVAIGIFLPSVATVERSAVVDAYPATVFALINDFHQIDKWSGWRATDPNLRFGISGARRGVGAELDWNGSILGRGSRRITTSVPYERVTILQDTDGSESSLSILLTDVGGTTNMVWRFERDFGLNVFARYFGLLLDGIIGPVYESDIDRLSRMAQSLPPSDFSDVDIEHVVVEAVDIAFIPTSSEPLAQAISAALGDAYFQVLSFIDANGLKEAGAPLSISRDFRGAELRFDAGIPIRGITDATPRSQNSVEIGRSYGGPVIRAKHVGSYLTLGRTHDKIAAYLAALGIERQGDAWESYVSDPTRTAADELVTYVYYPVRADDLDGVERLPE